MFFQAACPLVSAKASTISEHMFAAACLCDLRAQRKKKVPVVLVTATSLHAPTLRRSLLVFFAFHGKSHVVVFGLKFVPAVFPHATQHRLINVDTERESVHCRASLQTSHPFIVKLSSVQRTVEKNGPVQQNGLSLTTTTILTKTTQNLSRGETT